MKSKSKVKMFQGSITIPVKAFHEDIHPDVFQRLRRWSTKYPYPRNDRIDRKQTPQTYKTLVIENEYLKLTVLPELGGHLYSAYDKINNRDVLYRIQELNPVPLGLRGAWAPVGIEFNFPSAHSPTTLSPVDAVLRRNDDGSASIVIGDIERVSRMRWAIDIRLHPGCYSFKTIVRLHNRTAIAKPYFYWTNAAIPVNDSTKFVIPLKGTTGHGIPGRGGNWPMRNGVDISWHRNIKKTMGLFADTCREDFFGAYDVENDWGVVHVADYRDLPGKKMFTWGTGPQGLRKSRQYSPPSGPYAELQAGVLEHQPGSEMLAPHQSSTFEETWLPLYGMGVPFVRANNDAAVALEYEKGKGIHLAVNVDRDRGRCRVILSRNGKKLYSTSLNLSPTKPFSKLVRINGFRANGAPLELSVIAPDGEVLLSHTSRDSKPPDGHGDNKWLARKTHPDESSEWDGATGGNPERTAVRAQVFHKMGLHYVAKVLYEEALAKDPGLVLPNLRLGELCIGMAQWKPAIAHLERALARDPALDEAHYLLGLAHAGLGDDDVAIDCFWVALRQNVGDVPCLAQLGLASVRLGRLTGAVDFFERALESAPDDSTIIARRSVALRKLGREAEALKSVRSATLEHPTSHFLACEMQFLARKKGGKAGPGKARRQFDNLLADDPDAYIELACDYAAAGCYEDALTVIRMGIDGTSTKSYTYPLLCYYSGYYMELTGDAAGARKVFRRGGRMKSDFCFPGRTEAVPVLERALRLNPDDANAAHYLACLLYHRSRRDDAVKLWRRAQKLRPKSTLLCSILAMAAWDGRDMPTTLRWLRRARKLEPTQPRIIVWLLWALTDAGLDKEKLELLKRTLVKFPQNDQIREQYANTLLDMRKPARALELISDHQFATRHGMFDLTRLHVNCHTTLAEDLIARKNHAKALEHLEAAVSIPISLGEDETSMKFFGKVHYLSGLCLDKLGRAKEAASQYRKCVAERRRWLPVLRYYDYLSYTRLGMHRAAEKALKDLEHGMEHLKEHHHHPGAVHHLTSLLLRARGKVKAADKEARLARRLGKRPSHDLAFRFAFGFS